MRVLRYIQPDSVNDLLSAKVMRWPHTAVDPLDSRTVNVVSLCLKKHTGHTGWLRSSSMRILLRLSKELLCRNIKIRVNMTYGGKALMDGGGL